MKHSDAGLPVVLSGFLALWTLRSILDRPAGELFGNATDSIHHAWGLWWLASGGRQGSVTELVSYPAGEIGSILPPITGLLVSPVAALASPALAHNLACAFTLLLAAVGVGVFTALLGGRRAGAWAGLLTLCGRPLVAHIGLGMLEGATLGWSALAGAAMLRWVQVGGLPWALLAGLLPAVAVVDNPYALVLLLPAALLAAAARRRPTESAVAAFMGLALIALRLWWVGEGLGGNIPNPNEVSWAGRDWQVYDPDWNLNGAALLWPLPSLRLDRTALSIANDGSGFWLGWGVLIAAGWGAWRSHAARAALAVAALCLLLSAGSFVAGLPGPFLLLNLLLDAVLRPVTQPMRFLVFASGALAVAGGLGLSRLTARWRGVAAGLLVLEAVCLGGPGTKVPTTDTAATSCLSALDGGAVHLPYLRDTVTLIGETPLDAHERHSTDAKRLQLNHGRPGTHQGIGGWTVLPRSDSLAEDLTTFDSVWLGGYLPTAIESPIKSMRDVGIDWVVSLTSEAPPWAGEPDHRCGGWGAWELASTHAPHSLPIRRRSRR